MITATWSPTHLLRWTPRDGDERTWLVHVTRIEVKSHPWWLAQTADEHRRSAAPHWRYEAAADVWTWRGLGGFEGGIGAVRCEALDIAPVRDAAMPRGWRP